MKVTLITYGTRAELDSFMALGLQLQSLGYEVNLATSARFESRVQPRGIVFHPIRSDYRDLFRGDLARSMESRGILSWWKNLKSMILPMLRHTLKDALDVAAGSDALVIDIHFPGGYLLAEKLQIPAYFVSTVPRTPTTAFPAPGTVDPDRDLGGKFNRLTYAPLPAQKLPYLRTLNEFRSKVLKLPARSVWSEWKASEAKDHPLLYPFSEKILPIPEDWPSSLWVTGFWRLPSLEGWTPPRDLEWFLEDGSAPVLIYLGELDDEHGQWLIPLAMEAVSRSGQRGIVATSYQGFHAGYMSEKIMLTDPDTPQEWLFPRCTAVVHQGSTHNTAWSLFTARPTVTCSFHGDDTFWGRILFEVGVGPRPIQKKELSIERLTEAIRKAATDPDYRITAGSLRDRIKNENGALVAARSIQSHLSQAAEL